MNAKAATKLHRSILPQNPGIAEWFDDSAADILIPPEESSEETDMLLRKLSAMHPQSENTGFCEKRSQML